MTKARLNFEEAWAGKVPPHWRWCRNKELLTESMSVSLDGTEELLSVSHLTGITPKSEKNVTMTAAESLEGYRLVEIGDLVINTMWAWMGALGVSKHVGIVSPAYGVYSPRQNAPFDPGFYDYLYRSNPYVMEMTRLSRGIWSSRLRIYPDVFLSMAVPVPPLEEQRAIAEYLDRENARIDTLIEEQQQLIETLRERRVAAAVDAFASMRGEGYGLGDAYEPIPWLPELQVKRAQMRHVCTISTGSSDSADAMDEGYPFFVRGDQPLALDHYEFDTEAIITAGDGAMVGRSFHHYQGKFAAHQRVYVLRDFKGIFPRYLFWYFSTFFIRVVGDGGAQATVPSVRRPMIAGMPVPMPALDEQRRIAASLDEQTTQIDVLIGEAERFIELARERRSALITAAVTGQIDVRQGA